MKVILNYYAPISREVEIPDRFAPFGDPAANYDDKLWDDLIEYIENNPEFANIDEGSLETETGRFIAEW